MMHFLIKVHHWFFQDNEDTDGYEDDSQNPFQDEDESQNPFEEEDVEQTKKEGLAEKPDVDEDEDYLPDIIALSQWNTQPKKIISWEMCIVSKQQIYVCNCHMAASIFTTHTHR